MKHLGVLAIAADNSLRAIPTSYARAYAHINQRSLALQGRAAPPSGTVLGYKKPKQMSNL